MTEVTYQEQLLKFRELVIDDIKDSSNKEVSDYLHTAPDLWLYTLRTLRREVELQLSCQNAKLKMDIYAISNFDNSDLSSEYNKDSNIVDLKVKHHKWKMSVLKFLTNIENKALYVKMLLSNQQTINT